MKQTRIIMVLVLFAVTACSSRPGRPAVGPIVFVKVDLRRSYDSGGHAADGKLTVTDPAIINQLGVVLSRRRSARNIQPRGTLRLLGNARFLSSRRFVRPRGNELRAVAQ